MALPSWLGLVRTVPGYKFVVRRVEALDGDLKKFLRLFVFWGLRFCFWMIDVIAALNFAECADGCSFVEAPRKSCQALILAIAIFNFFSLVAFIIFLLVRYTSGDRDRVEARLVTRVLISVGLVLKLADIGITVAVTTTCFPDSATPPYENFMSMTQCAGTVQKPACPVMDFFALYAIYAVLKVRQQYVSSQKPVVRRVIHAHAHAHAHLRTYLPVTKVFVMAADVIIITPQMVRKSRDWYQASRL